MEAMTSSDDRVLENECVREVLKPKLGEEEEEEEGGSERGFLGKRKAESGSNTKVLDKAFEGLVMRERETAMISKVSKMLFKQMSKLAVKEKEVEARLDRERVEHLLDKVEDEVEYEGIMEEMCVKFKAEDEAMEMARKEREWELERREVRLEEELGILKGKVRRLEEELKIAHAEKDYAVQKKQDEMDEIIQRTLMELREGEEDRVMNDYETCFAQQQRDIEALMGSVDNDRDQKPFDSPNQAILYAFEDLLKETDARTEQEKRALENAIHAKEEAEERYQHDRHKWRVREKEMESQVLALEKEIGRMSSSLRERESSLIAERERRKEMQNDADRILAMWKEEKLAHKDDELRLKRVDHILSKMKEAVVKEQSKIEINVQGQEFMKELDKNIKKLCSVIVQKKDNIRRFSESEQVEIWKIQRDAAIAERDNLEDKLNLMLKRARDREGEIDAMWLEREKILVDKVDSQEKQSAHWELKCRRRETEVLQERKSWEQEMESLRKDMEDEKSAWECMVREREDWMKMQEERWICLLESKERELLSLKAAQEKLLDLLEHDNHRSEEVKSQTASKGQVCDMVNESKQYEDEDDIHGRSAKELIVIQETRKVEENEIGGDITQVGKLTSEFELKEERLERERNELKTSAERFRQERKELERKVAETLALMNELKCEIHEKEVQMEWDRKKMDSLLTSKNAEVENLKSQLGAKEQEMEIKVQKLQNEICLLGQEIEKECKESERVTDLHFAYKKKLALEMEVEKEKWENQLKTVVQELMELKAELTKKNLEILELKNALNLRQAEHRQEIEISPIVRDVKEAIGWSNEMKVAPKKAYQKISVCDFEDNLDASKTSLQVLDLGIPDSNLEQSTSHKEWHFALNKVAVFDKQITEAMIAIQNLREELSAKEIELLKAKSDPGAYWASHEQQCYLERQEWQKREQELANKNKELLKLLESERSDSNDAIAILQGIIRELEWSLSHSGRTFNKDVHDVMNTSNVGSVSKMFRKADMVKVHASHLQDVDQCISNLKLKVEELEKKLGTAELLGPRKSRVSDELDAALLHIEKEIICTSSGKRLHLNTQSSTEGNAKEETGSIHTGFTLPVLGSSEIFLSPLCASSSILDHSPSTGGAERTSLSQPLMDGKLDTLHQKQLSLTMSAVPRRQQKWLVDAAWLDQVRKEQAMLRHQLAIEQQRSSTLSQVEAENRWIEALVIRALEQKRDCQRILLDMEKKVTLLEDMLHKQHRANAASD